MIFAVVDDERPSRSELCHILRTLQPEATLLEADSGAGALSLATGQEIAVFFLDIHLGDMEGTVVASLLHQLQPKAKIVFATAYDSYAVKAFELQATDYLLKPFDPHRIAQCLEKLLAEKAESPAPEEKLLTGRLTVTTQKRTIVLPVDTLAYIETDSHTCILHTTQGNFVSNLPLSHYEKKLTSYPFFRIHKSYFVNLDYIVELSPWVNGLMGVKLRDFAQYLPVGRRQLKALRELFEA